MAWTTDLRYALRRLARAPGFVAASVAMLVLGVGLSVAMYSMLRGVVLQGLPYPGSERLLAVAADNLRQDVNATALTPAEVNALEADAGGPAFAATGGYQWGGITLYDGEHPREATVGIVSQGFFPTLGMAPLHGRWFRAEDHGQPFATVVLSHTEWQRLLGGRVEALGTLIETSEGRLRVIGVMPPQFAFPDADVGAWLPRAAFPTDHPMYANARFVFGVARLREDANAILARERLAALSANVRSERSLPDIGWRIGLRPLLDDVVGDARGALWGAFGIALLVLLVACANLAILFDARQVARAQELAVNRALGASRGRLWRMLLLELLLLAGTGVGLGVLAAAGSLDALRRLAADSVPRVDAIALDAGVIGFAALLAVATPLLVLLAGVRRPGAASGEALRGAGRSVISDPPRARRVLPALAIALSTLGVIVAAALAHGLMRLGAVDPGFRTADVHAMQLYREGGPALAPAYSEALRQRLSALPGIEAVAVTSVAPLSVNGAFAIDLLLPGRAEPEAYQASLRRVSAGYLDVLDIPLLAGRAIGDEDREGSEAVAMVNRELARRSFPGRSPLGEQLLLPLGRGERVPFRVVGVMEDIRNDGLRAEPAPEILIAAAQRPAAGLTFLVRSAMSPPGLAAQMAEAAWSVDPRQPLTRQFLLQEDLDAQLASMRFFARTVGAFALSALFLGAFGVYAVATLQQRRRVKEFGLRLALGARPAALARQVLGEGARVVVAGVALGASGAWAARQLLVAQSYDLEGRLPWVVMAGIAIMAIAALVALSAPALRAARTDPMTALRDE